MWWTFKSNPFRTTPLSGSAICSKQICFKTLWFCFHCRLVKHHVNQIQLCSAYEQPLLNLGLENALPWPLFTFFLQCSTLRSRTVAYRFVVVYLTMHRALWKAWHDASDLWVACNFSETSQFGDIAVQVVDTYLCCVTKKVSGICQLTQHSLFFRACCHMLALHYLLVQNLTSYMYCRAGVRHCNADSVTGCVQHLIFQVQRLLSILVTSL